MVNALDWWIVEYDHESKMWFEATYPKSAKTVTGMIQNKDNPELNVDLTPVPATDGLDRMVYKISLAVVPGANVQYTLSFANNSTGQVAKAWGLVVGNLAPSSVIGVVP